MTTLALAAFVYWCTRHQLQKQLRELARTLLLWLAAAALAAWSLFDALQP
jgi:hypothetical protein